MNHPKLITDSEIEIDDVVEVTFGPFFVWFVHAGSLDGLGTMVAFSQGERMYGRVCLQPAECENGEWQGFTDGEREVYNRWEGRRCCRHLPPAAFYAEWASISDPYLFPKKKGRITTEMPLNKDADPMIVADWLQDNEMDEIAEWVRLMKPNRKRKFELMRELVAEFRDEDLKKNPNGPIFPNVITFHNWCLEKLKEEEHK